MWYQNKKIRKFKMRVEVGNCLSNKKIVIGYGM